MTPEPEPRPLSPMQGPRTPTGPAPESLPELKSPPALLSPTGSKPSSDRNSTADQSFESGTSEDAVPPFQMITENQYISAAKYLIYFSHSKLVNYFSSYCTSRSFDQSDHLHIFCLF